MRMEQQVMTRKVPVTTYKTVTERVEKMVPVQVCKYVPEEIVKQVPVQTTKYVEETQTEPYQVPSLQDGRRTTSGAQAEDGRKTERRSCGRNMIPRTVVTKIPLDAFGNPIEVRETTPTSVKTGKPTLADDVEKESVMKKDDAKKDAEKTEAKKPLTAEDKAPKPEAF